MEINPNFDTYYNRGLAKAELQNYKGALADFTEAIRINPNLAYVYYNRAVIKYYSGDKNGACKDARKAEDLGMDTSSFIEAACS